MQILNVACRKRQQLPDADIEALEESPFMLKRFELSGEPDQYHSLLSIALMKFCYNDEDLEQLIDKLDLFINEKNLFKEDSTGKTPLLIAIEKAASSWDEETQDLLVEIAVKLIEKMNLIGPDVNLRLMIRVKH